MTLTANVNTHVITLTRGDDALIRYTVLNTSGVAYNVASNSFKFTVKDSVDDVIGDAKFQKTNPAASGIDLTLASAGTVDVNIDDTDTQALAGTYDYDLEMTESGKVYTLDQGMLVIKKDVTTPGTAGTSSSALVSFPGGFYVGSGGFYLLDLITGQYSGFRLESGVLVQSSSQSSTIPFTY